MTTNTHIQPRGARRRLLLVLAASTAILSSTTAALATTPSTPTTVPLTRVAVRALPLQTARPASYDWPVVPFDRQHPVRGFFDDPRIGRHGSKAFHFGIDIAVPDGTPVYAVEAGTVHFDSGRAICVVSPDGSHSFGYWHIVPVVRSHQDVRRHQLLGYVEKPWGHVHLAERRAGEYVNPLRPGALGPYRDRVAPTVARVSVVDEGARFGLVAEAYDMPDPRVPGPWAGEPVTPALLRWRLTDGRGAGAWHVAIDFRRAFVPASEFDRVYAPGTTQNHEGRPGRYRFWLTRTLDPAVLDGSTRLEVEASDGSGNTSRAVGVIPHPAAGV